MLAQDISHLVDMRDTMQADIQSWLNTEKAQEFVMNAQEFVVEINRIIEGFNYKSHYYSSRQALLELIKLLQDEQMQPLYGITHATVQGNLFRESHVRGVFPESAWPLRSCWKALEERSSAYHRALIAIDGCKHTSVESEKYAKLGHDVLRALSTALNVIAGFTHYSEELRQEKDFALREEQARQARITAEAAQKTARAQRRLADAQAEHNKQSKEQELASLGINSVPLSVAFQWRCDYYLRQQRWQLQERVHALKIELYGSESFWGALVNLMIDKD